MSVDALQHRSRFVERDLAILAGEKHCVQPRDVRCAIIVRELAGRRSAADAGELAGNMCDARRGPFEYRLDAILRPAKAGRVHARSLRTALG